MFKDVFTKTYTRPFFFAFLLLLNTSLFVKSAYAIAQSEVEKLNCPSVRGDYSTPTYSDPMGSGAEINSQVNNSQGSVTFQCKDKIYLCTNNDCTERDYEKASGGVLAWIGENIAALASFLLRWLILYPINILLSWVMTLASFAFDLIVYLTVLKFKTNFADMQIGSILPQSFGDNLISFLWGAIRDLLNIIIFLLIIYHSVLSMFEGFENTKKKFIALLVFSIIVNFSLLFVKLSIDISNILALQAYTLAIKPTGSDSWSAFSKSSVQGGPNSYGEYIMKTVSFGKLMAYAPGQKDTNNAPAKNEVSDLKETFMFNVGLLIMQVGIIYLLLYMAGLLVMRAGIFIYAMILSPLLVMDIFFGAFSKTSTGIEKLQEFSKKLTDGIRGDFYDSLVKGPLLLFFMFLIGVFTSAIFSSKMESELQAIVKNYQGFSQSGLSVSIISNLFIFFKFVIFFALCKITLDRIKDIKPFGESGHRLNNFGKAVANYTLGRGFGGASRLAGYGLQNTLGRYASGDNILGRNLTRLSNKTLNWKNADPNTYTGMFKRAIGGGTFGTINAIKTGTYDAGNLVGKVDKLTGGILAKGVKGALGTDIDFGKRVTDSFSDRDKAALKKRQEAREKNIKEAEKGDIVTPTDIKKANDDTSIEFGKFKTSLTTFSSILGDDKFKNAVLAYSGTGSLRADGDNIGMNLSEDQAKSLKDTLSKYGDKDADILLKIKEANEKAGKKAEESAHHRGEHRAEHIAEEYKSGERSGVGTLGKITDVVALRDRPLQSIFGEGSTSKELRIDTAKTLQKHAKEEAGKNRKMADFITGNFYKSSIDTLQEIKKAEDVAARKGIALTADQVKAFAEARTIVGDFITNISNFNKKDNADAIKKFNEESFKKIVDTKKAALTSATDITSKGVFDPATGTIDKQVSTLNNNTVRLLGKLGTMTEDYEKFKPKKDDGHGKDAKPATPPAGGAHP